MHAKGAVDLPFIIMSGAADFVVEFVFQIFQIPGAAAVSGGQGVGGAVGGDHGPDALRHALC